MGYRRKRDNINYPIRKNNVKGTKGLKLTQKENIQIHDLLLNTFMSFKEIANQYSVLPYTISDINAGKTQSYRLDGYNYPLRKNIDKRSISRVTLTMDIVLEIHKDLLEGKETCNFIAKKYNTSSDIVNRINNGKCSVYMIEGYTYPLRTSKINKLTEKDVCDIYEDLKNSTMTLSQIAKKFNVTDTTIANINKGKSHKKENTIYPIRVKA